MDALLPQASVSRHNVGSMSVTCTYCNATGFPKEKKKGKNQGVNLGRLCCTAGTSMFNNFPELPEDLMSCTVVTVISGAVMTVLLPVVLSEG